MTSGFIVARISTIPATKSSLKLVYGEEDLLDSLHRSRPDRRLFVGTLVGPPSHNSNCLRELVGRLPQ